MKMKILFAVSTFVLGLQSVNVLAVDKITNKLFVVEAANDEWTATDINVSSGDLLLIEEQGNKITVGAWLGATDANGNPGGGGEGALEMKIGVSAGKKVGAHYFQTVTIDGALKLKVYDTKYEDNTGHFVVKVTVIPTKLIPAAEPLQQ